MSTKIDLVDTDLGREILTQVYNIRAAKQERNRLVVNAALDGFSLRQLTEATGLAVNTVVRILKDNGVHWVNDHYELEVPESDETD